MSRLVALLFTDLVGSTEILDRLGDERAEALRRTHFGLLRDAVITTGGQEVKNLGDGLMVVFESAVGAVACAVAMQRAVAAHNRIEEERLEVRIGLHAGEPTEEEDDYFGSPVVVAQRLCGAAGPEQILASDLLRALVSGRGGHVFGDPAPVTLKGFAEPVAACELVWGRDSDDHLPPPRRYRRRDTPSVRGESGRAGHLAQRMGARG